MYMSATTPLMWPASCSLKTKLQILSEGTVWQEGELSILGIAKGVVEVYDQLKGLDLNLVTSGKKSVSVPATNLRLDYRDYLRLLKASSVVVTMSKFKVSPVSPSYSYMPMLPCAHG